MVTWNTTIAVGGTPPGSPKEDPTEVTLATVGPFTVVGYCGNVESTQAETDLVTTQDGSSLQWDDEQHNGIFNNDGPYQVSQDANGSPGNPDWIGPSAGDQANEFAAISADGKTSITGFPNEGVYVQGAQGPACTFTGYLVNDAASG